MDGKRDNPNPLFSTEYYINCNDDVDAAGIEPLCHYLKYGWKERRNPNPFFSTEYYLNCNDDVDAAEIEPLCHYLKYGWKERRNPDPFFSTEYYLNCNDDVDAAGIEPLCHFLQFGAAEGRNPSSELDLSTYLKEHPDAVSIGLNPLVHSIISGTDEGLQSQEKTYERWILDFDTVTEKDIDRIRNEIDSFTNRPLISVIMPVYNTPEKYLRLAAESVLKQLYDNWELCVTDDASTENHVWKVLSEYASKDTRIKIFQRKSNGHISRATNDALSMAKGDFIGFLDHDDELSPFALYEVVKTVNQYNPDVIYSDEDFIDKKGRAIHVHFKPDYSPDLLNCHNYITHFLVVKRSRFLEVGGLKPEYDGAQDYDLLLRLLERTSKVYHIPKVLYHWRMIKTSTSFNQDSKGYANSAGKAALEKSIRRREIEGEVQYTNTKFFYHVKYLLSQQPLISIIIPFKDQHEYTKKCIHSVLKNSRYKNFEIIGISNNSEENTTFEMMKQLEKADERIRFFKLNIPFNYSKINNYAASLASGSHLVLMNNDIEIITDKWIEALLEHSQRDEIGAVGAKLYYPNDTVQHAGVILGIAGFAGHSHRHAKRNSPGYFNRLNCIQNISAVTGALLMVKKELYERVGGLDEDNLGIALNDVDFCLKLRKINLLNIFTPFCEAYHFESASRGYEDSPEKISRFECEKKYFQNKWQKYLSKGDPYYNCNLTLSYEDFSLNFVKNESQL